MEISNYISRMKIFYSSFIKFIEANNDTQEGYDNFIAIIKSNKFGENPDELRSMLRIIHKVFSHHRRHSSFISKTHKTILYFADQIKQAFSNSDIYRIFRSNKLLLIFLFEQKIITIDENIIYQLYEKYQKDNSNYFYTEFQPFLNQENQGAKIKLINTSKVHGENFEKKRQEGENDSPICQLIRKDSINEFLTYVREKKVPLYNTVPKSFFETNSLLKKKESTLIEYAAFFGSIQIFQYLLKSNVKISPTIWIYAIHSSNLDLINLLEKYKIKPEYQSYRSSFFESIKCHHNELAHYIRSNLYTNDEDDTIGSFFMKYSKYYNFEYFIDDLNDNYETIFDFSCKNDYMMIVKILLKKGIIDLKELLIRKSILNFSFYKIQN